ncbi:MBL fold metallo-hydrolase [Leifsonia shinshuensis]|uniref:MBL fold metallo-hydrolase n=1 Tax=Leifsonia shinshuensis TaxID=150026 RepID=UPI002866A171|nr:MBL fold metallo-hydrolase [Leifsonia shinshuensis]MDR6973119.1 L-ascorbate metabolism protein UlaG (beta-lactamase superfamily) [Leifsonia shinshuensis]
MTRISADRRRFGVGVIGGPTTVIDVHGLRIVVDPTFDPPGDYGYLQKTAGPAIAAEALGGIDVVLVSHAQHPDNLDAGGRRVALESPLVLTTPSSASELGATARGLVAWERFSHPAGVRITATPALHGPADEVTPEGYVNCEVSGFVIEAPDAPSVYVGGDNASLRAVAEVARRFPGIDVALLNAGAAHVPAKYDDRPLTFTAERAAAAAEVLDARHVVVAHQDGWAHFADGPAETERAFERAGIRAALFAAPLGSWSVTEEVLGREV